MIGFLSRPVFFLVAGIGILLAGAYVLARGASGRRRFSFVQVSLAVGLWVILYGILLQPGADPASDRTWAELFVFFSLLTAATLYQFVTYGLGFGRRSRAPGERRLGIWLLWGACAAVGLLMLFGGLEMVSSVGAPPADSLLVLRWQAIPVVVAVWTGILGAVLITLRTARRSSVIERSSLAAWVIVGLGAFCVVPLVLHSSLFGAWGTGLAGVSALAGTAILARAARLGPVGAEALPPLAKTVLGGLEGPAVVLARDGSVEAVNPAFRDTFEFGRRRLVGKNVAEVVEEVGGASLALSSLSLDVKEEGQEVRLRGPDGRWTSARATACRLGHVEGEALPVFLLFTPESMDRRAVARSNPLDRWLRYEFRPEVPGLARFDLPDGRITAVNDQFAQLAGHDRSGLIGQEAAQLGLAVETSRWHRFFERLPEARKAEEQEFEWRRAPGDARHVQCFAASVVSEEADEAILLVRDLTARKEAEEKLRGEVLYDGLTGLPNRILFREQLDQALERAQRYGHHVAVLFIDLEGFREVNDEHGPPAGDQVLAAVAWRLYECFRQMDTLCRYGGDEFLVLLEDLEDRTGAGAAADRFRRYMEAPFELEGGTEVRVGVTIGIAVSSPGHTEGDDLVRWADVAMYRAKRQGESPIRIYDPERDAGEMERLSRADELRQAIERRELALHYQPLVSLADDRIVGAEALVRWPQPSGELRSPGEFLPLAEETGLIVPMSEWIFEEASRRAVGWRRLVPDFAISVNVAAQHFRDRELPEQLSGTLAETGLPAEALELEITESAALRDAGAIDRLRELGVRVTVDDFGTGYSSLEYLRGLNVDAVKIDRVFVPSLIDDPKDQAIVRAVLLIAEAFELEVTAEGIETEEQYRWFRGTGCHLAQGYYFSRPVPPEEFEKLLEEGRAHDWMISDAS